MPRAGLGLGEYGEVWYSNTHDGRFIALANVRGFDGRTRQRQASGRSRTAAKAALVRAIDRELSAGSVDTEALTAESTITELSSYWMERKHIDGSVREQTAVGYQRVIDEILLPHFGEVKIREITAPRVDAWFLQMAKESRSRPKRVRGVFGPMLDTAVRLGLIPANPVRSATTVHRDRKRVVALSIDDVSALRAALRARDEVQAAGHGPKPNRLLGDIVEIALGSGLRIGELLAIRVMDLDMTARPALLRVSGTMVEMKGKPPFRQSDPKTESGLRTIALPSFAAAAVRHRLAIVSTHGPESLLFQTRNGTPIRQANVRRDLRAAYVAAELSWDRAPFHILRRTAGTLVHSDQGTELASKMLGHRDGGITLKHYIASSEEVNPITARVLDRLIGDASEDLLGLDEI